MKFVYRIFLILFLIPLNVLSQFNDDGRVIFEGFVISSNDSTALKDIHLINYTSDKVTATLSKGLFRIPVKAGDKIYFSGVQYGLIPLIITDSIIEIDRFRIYLQPKIYELDATQVMPFLNYKEFKQAFLDLKLEDSAIELNLPAPVIIPDLKPGETAPLMVISGPITALYMQFSKEGKSIKKYHETLQKAKYEKYITSKYNQEFVQKITGIDDDNTLKAFMEFCNFTDKFIGSSTEYELIAAIEKCLSVFTNSN